MAVFEKRVVASTDDANYRMSDDDWRLATGPLPAGRHSATIKQYGCGMRFTDVTIPQGSTITTAYIIFTSLENLANITCNTRITGEDTDNAVTFADDFAAFVTRYNNHTTAVIDWDDIPAWSIDEEGADTTSSEIKTVIKEIVDRGGWSSGNALVLFWQDYDDRSVGDVSRRSAYAWDDDPAKAPLLHIEYTPPVVAVGRSFGYIIG